MKYRKKPVVIEAVQFTIGHEAEAIAFLGGYTAFDRKKIGQYETDTAIFKISAPHSVNITIKTLEGNMEVKINDYIIKGVKGEFYPCKPDIFEQTYEPAV